jgi:hypothetical protein
MILNGLRYACLFVGVSCSCLYYFKIVWDAYGDYLFKNAHFDRAGLAFYLGGNMSRSIESYKNGMLWRKALSVAEESGHTNEQLHELAQSIAGMILLKSLCKVFNLLF